MNRTILAVFSICALMCSPSVAQVETTCKMDAAQCERLAKMNQHMQEVMDGIREDGSDESDETTESIGEIQAVPANSGKVTAKRALTKSSPSTRDYKAGMMRMHKGMNITYTGSTDTDFTRGMIPHHQGAIDMAQTELKYGKDEAMRSLAKQIITAQKQEIAFMKTWLTRRADRNSKRSKKEIAQMDSVKGFEEANHDMHQNMMLPYTGNADIDFARMMIPHHQGAIDMARVFMQHGGQDPDLHKIARDIQLSQNREISDMLSWLEKNTDKLKARKNKQSSKAKAVKAPVKASAKTSVKAASGSHSGH